MALPETENEGVPAMYIANLISINLKALRKQCPDAIAKLIEAARRDGILYLDLADGDDAPLSEVTHGLDVLCRSVFDASIQEKMKLDVDEMGKYRLNGYKPIGRNRGCVKGQRDGFESYVVSRDVISPQVGNGVPHLPIVEKHKHTLAEFTSTCADAAHIIFKTLSLAFDLPEETSFQSCHRSLISSLDVVRLLKYPGAIGANSFGIPQLAHTDMGSLTFLFTKSPGLQILPAGSEKWQYVTPREGQLIVNLGDAMNILSNGELQSVLHRVVTVPGNEVQDRYSLAFLMRPDPPTLMKPLPGFGNAGSLMTTATKLEPPRTCEEWVLLKFKTLRNA